MSSQEIGRRLAVLEWMARKIKDRQEVEKAAYQDEKVGRGTDYIVDDEGREIGSLQVAKGRKSVSVDIADEAAALAWAVDNFGESVIGLSAAGRKSVIEAAKRGTPVPGVDVVEKTGDPSVRWVPHKPGHEDGGADVLVESMLSRGLLTLDDALAIEEGRP
ncbi:hypothetical protein NCCP2495_05770 [Dietzia sp. NCCP-2495]|uniref:hypothetical protein n=1 Tax=Dietzia sp. NCCP-2495 TaxID=2934675 RepID=UPI00223034C5|nr:hypothetical protein [Dietzia sp. NCCP-2495]GLB62699.1 hypothetical protein NCCP2495_05770 [Dietzia sp. NCCP-2495]